MRHTLKIRAFLSGGERRRHTYNTTRGHEIEFQIIFSTCSVSFSTVFDQSRPFHNDMLRLMRYGNRLWARRAKRERSR